MSAELTGLPDNVNRDVVREIVRTVCNTYFVTLKELKSDSHESNTTMVRRILVYLLKENTRMSFESIGWFLGRRSHSTALRGHQAIVDHAEIDTDFFCDLERLQLRFIKNLKATDDEKADLFLHRMSGSGGRGLVLRAQFERRTGS